MHREFKHQSGVGLVVYHEELANLICLVSLTLWKCITKRILTLCNGSVCTVLWFVSLVFDGIRARDNIVLVILFIRDDLLV